MNYKDFFNQLYKLNAISSIWEKILDMLREMEKNISDQALDIFCIYFSLLDDGNTCIALNKEKLLAKWMKKWNGLLLVNEVSEEEKDILQEKDFEHIIEEGLKSFKDGSLKSIIEDNPSEENKGKIFIISNIDGNDWLFAEKYYCAKNIIEERIKKLFLAGQKKSLDKKSIADEFEKLTDKKFKLKERQLEAIARGQKENLIITGGPGTGKTTVITYLLWELFKDEDNLKKHLYLAAPSGKAADRMKESILEAINKINCDSDCAAFKKLNTSDSYTIHRLLSYAPQENSFIYNSENQFNKDSIFVIDEASMIDIDLFASLLAAIPDQARVFILGDKDQLPSVQAGAVLGEILSKKKDSVVELNESNRFNSDSEIGRLKDAVQNEQLELKDFLHFEKWSAWKKDFPSERNAGENPVDFIELDEGQKGKEISEIVCNWSAAFYDHLADKKISPAYKLKASFDKENLQLLDKLWTDSMKAKILCAERRGLRGVENINKIICDNIREKNQLYDFSQGNYFPGQLLMINQNQKMYKLYNGDCGIVVRFENNPFLYLMIEKSAEGEEKERSFSFENRIFAAGRFMFYPLYLLPGEALETAYAITIHKSQGSGYDNILIFLPEQEQHPLLNRQIFYTAITRTSGSTYIVASEEILCNARKNIIERDTMIQL